MMLATTLAVSGFAGAIAGIPVVEAASKNPTSDATIEIIGYTDGYIDWSTSKYVYVGKNVDGKASKVKGLSYDKKTNTLTVNGFNKPKMGITASGMGSGFKIVVKGKKNNIQNLSVFGTVTIKGSGTLTINKNKKCSNGGLSVSSEEDPIKLVLAKKVKVTAYGDDYADALYVGSTLTDVDKAIVCQGGSMTECKLDGQSESGVNRFVSTANKFVKK